VENNYEINIYVNVYKKIIEIFRKIKNKNSIVQKFKNIVKDIFNFSLIYPVYILSPLRILSAFKKTNFFLF
jgi:hypothetical protein